MYVPFQERVIQIMLGLVILVIALVYNKLVLEHSPGSMAREKGGGKETGGA